MKVALIGNMNNNYFALLRYLRDSGVDAELLVFAGEMEMFSPENDTWEIEKWRPYIKQLNIVGGALGQFFKMSAADIRKEFEGYDYYIGCGFTPAYFYKAGMQLDVFNPYCIGIEYTYRISKSSWIHSIKEKIEAYFQFKGLKNNTRMMATLDEESRVKGEGLGMKVLPYAIPMIYNKEALPASAGDDLDVIINRFKQHSTVVFSHVSHYPPGTRTFEAKRNDILIKAFASYLRSDKGHNPLLVLFDFGENSSYSKKLVEELGITDAVMWLPVMSRKKIMLLLQHADFGGGEFGGDVWGGTGWEFMASGVPFFQYVNIPAEQFKDRTGMELPPFFNSNDPGAITEMLTHYTKYTDELKQIGERLKVWFHSHGGEKLADIYKQLILNSSITKSYILLCSMIYL